MTVTRERVPVLQNRVYDTLSAALAAPHGRFELAACAQCGFGHNAAFDPSLVEYDEHYDNQVPSAVMDAHYCAIVDRLAGRFDLADGFVLDVGCGKGTFLDTAARCLPRLRGLGVDPSYEGAPSAHEGRLHFVSALFDADHVTQLPSLVVCRHVLEHLPRPVAFLQSLRAALHRYPQTPIFVEVPEVSWITEHSAFWDFCYEHCNYFDAHTLKLALGNGGFTGPFEQGVFFGNQYQWIEHDPKLPTQTSLATRIGRSAFPDYARREAQALSDCSARLDNLQRQGFVLAVWGMATKGVMFVNLVDPHRDRIQHCIDINVTKQGAFVPLTGHRIEPPAALRERAVDDLAVLVMNPNYIEEIRAACVQLGVRARFFDASALPVA
jgi:SAM-dependent methyltransferase